MNPPAQLQQQRRITPEPVITARAQLRSSWAALRAPGGLIRPARCLPEIAAVRAHNRRYGTVEVQLHCKKWELAHHQGITTVFIVQGKPRSPEGILKIVKATREEAFQAARDLLGRGMAFVTIIADGRVYTMEEFALTIDGAQQQFH